MKDKYQLKLQENIKIYDEVVCNKIFVIKQEETNLELMLTFKPQNYMHLVGFRYNEKRNAANKFYHAVKDNNLDWNKVRHSNYEKHYTDEKLKVFNHFFVSTNFNMRVSPNSISLIYEISDKKMAKLEIEKQAGSDLYFPKSLKKVPMHNARGAKNIRIHEISKK